MSSVFDFFLRLFGDVISAIKGWNLGKKLLVTCTLIAFVLTTLFVDIPSLQQFRYWSDELGPVFPVIFTVLYVLITQFPIPRTLLTLSSGVLFGPLLGIFIALMATTVSAAISLTIIRHFLGDWMAPRLTHPAVARINHRLRERGWLAITSLRMIAAVPFSILNYVAALTSVPLIGFTVATLVGSAPGTIATVLLGNTLTGDTDPFYIVSALVLMVIGFGGLALDTKLPVKDEQ
ncbi:TVP38/TMEM64 family protein [Corynebacterium sp. ZY180755]